MAVPSKIDWIQARNDYLQDVGVSYSDLSKKYGVSLTTMKARGAREGWPALRQSLAEKAFAKFQDKLLDQKSQAQDQHLKLYRNLQALCNTTMQSMANAGYMRDKKGNLVLDKNNNPIPVAPDPFELEKLSKALDSAIKGERVVLGLPTSVSGLTDGKGDSMWTGFAEMIKHADEILGDGDGQTDTSVSGSPTTAGDQS